MGEKEREKGGVREQSPPRAEGETVSEGGREGERERERGRERERHAEIGRQRDRGAGYVNETGHEQRERHSERAGGRERDRKRGSQSERETARERKSHPGYNIRANGASQKWTLLRMLPASGTIL